MLLRIYKKYSNNIFGFINNIFAITNKDNSEIQNSKNKRNLKEIKNKFNIKSTEKTLQITKNIIIKPHDIEFNNLKNNINFKYTNNIVKILKDNQFSKNIINSYIYNKKIFNDIFIDNYDKNIINDLDSFYNFYKDNINNKIKFNILLKFYSDDKLNEYNYILVKKNNLIKIKNNIEYDKIFYYFYKNNKIFLLKNNNEEEYYILNGDYINKKINSEEIKQIFFTNKNNNDNNYNMLKKYNNIQIIFFTCVKINL